jgi:predicted DNA-binding protein with PD1-like motif
MLAERNINYKRQDCRPNRGPSNPGLAARCRKGSANRASTATVAWFDPQAHQFREIAVAEQVELLALSGDVAEQDGRAAVHAHVVLGTRDGTTRGGHLIAGHVRPTLELVVDEAPAHLRRRYDPESGLALIALQN